MSSIRRGDLLAWGGGGGRLGLFRDFYDRVNLIVYTLQVTWLILTEGQS